MVLRALICINNKQLDWRTRVQPWRNFAAEAALMALEIIPVASHLFPEPGALDIVRNRAGRWFQRYLRMTASAARPM